MASFILQQQQIQSTEKFAKLFYLQVKMAQKRPQFMLMQTVDILL